MKKPGKSKYEIEYTDIVVKKHIKKLTNTAKIIIKKVIEDKLTTDPIRFGKSLNFSLKHYRRLKVGNYRVIYTIQSSKKVLIHAIGHRKEIYKKYEKGI